MGCVIGIQFAELQLSFQSAVATLFQPEENEGATRTLRSCLGTAGPVTLLLTLFSLSTD